MRRWAWTVDEIRALPGFGNEHGWFYGLVHDKGFHLAEIFPGLGYASTRDGWRPANPAKVVRDVWTYPPRAIAREGTAGTD